MQTVLLATGLPDIEESILGSSGTEFVVTEIATTREQLISSLNQNQPPNIVVISYMLQGEADILDILYSLRMVDVRAIFVAPGFNPADPTMKKVLDYGVYDIVPGNTFGDVLEKIRVPNTFKDAQDLLSKPGHSVAAVEGRQLFQVNRVNQNEKRGSDRLNNVIGVWSPTPSGKTLVSVNLATVLAEKGCSVALIDFDTANLALHTWLGVPPEEDALFAALESFKEPENDIRNYFYRYGYLPALNILTADPMGVKPLIKEKTGIQFLKFIAEEFDYVIVDTASSFDDPLTKACFSVCEKVFLVTDLDNHHLLSLHKALETVEKSFNLENFKLLVNRFLESPELLVNRIEIATGIPVAYSVPEIYREVLESIKGGVPVVFLSPVLKTCFRQLLELL